MEKDVGGANGFEPLELYVILARTLYFSRVARLSLDVSSFRFIFYYQGVPYAEKEATTSDARQISFGK